MPLNKALAQAGDLATKGIFSALAGLGSPVAQAVAHAVKGGKGLRAFLVLESARIHGVSPDRATPAAAAIEALHAYSLVHDDLPCLDNDDLRRGQPTVHVKWDEATAVLAGDALHSLAFQLVMDVGTLPENKVCLSQTLARAAGLRGMVGGQEMDIAAETALKQLTLKEITTLQAGKTGALIRWSAMAGPRMVSADTRKLGVYGTCLGLAFQIADDILDVTGDASKVGKALGKDATAGKATFVSTLGLEGAKKLADAQIDMACDALSGHGTDADALREVARFVVSRDS
ncbi:MAG: polyprenyl synthetase family protein [Rhodobacteraceae bacterium]|nr:polyprenyl synthetase family protein [Paracoccaceae bacterium]